MPSVHFQYGSLDADSADLFRLQERDLYTDGILYRTIITHRRHSALWLRGLPFSISAGVGFIALFGVAVLNGILMINHYDLRKQNKYAMTTNQIIKKEGHPRRHVGISHPYW